MKTVEICGIPHTIEEVPVIDEEREGVVQGEITYNEAKILVKKDLPYEIKQEVLMHEVIHGILYHIGESELCSDERFVQALTNGICNSGLKLQIIESEMIV
jgi:hypothetical protein